VAAWHLKVDQVELPRQRVTSRTVNAEPFFPLRPPARMYEDRSCTIGGKKGQQKFLYHFGPDLIASGNRTPGNPDRTLGDGAESDQPLAPVRDEGSVEPILPRKIGAKGQLENRAG
jgi:hypothetical protein